MFSNSIVVQEVLTKDGPIPASERYDDYVSLEGFVESFVEQNPSVNIRMFLHKSILFLRDGERYIYANQSEQESIDSTILSRDLRTRWIYNPAIHSQHSNQGYFSVLVDILSLRGFGERLAYVSFELEDSTVREVLSNMDTPSVSNVYVIDHEGRVLSALRDDVHMPQDAQALLAKDILQSDKGTHSTSVITGERDSLFVYTQLNNFPLTLAVEIPTKEIQDRSREILYQFIWITLLVIGISFVISYAISAGMTRRIQRLVSAMQTIESSDFTVQVPTNEVDEIGIMTKKFNWMVNRISFLIQTVYKTDMEKKQAELNLLQTQINPHFLYNTLDSINWLAIRHKADDIVYMIQNLSEFMRLSLNSDRKVTIQTEIRHLQAYFNIQKYRFEQLIHLKLEVPRELYAYQMISLILQPLVENALIHGILKEDGREGTITIRGELNDDVILLEVMDDGIGMTKDELKKINEHLLQQPDSSRSRGLRNVNQRITMEYGEEFGLNIISEQGRGTSCIIVFPAIK